MFFPKRSFAQPLSSALAHYSSKPKMFDPRSPELKQVMEPWAEMNARKKGKFNFFKFVDRKLRATDILKTLQTPIDLRTSKISSWWNKRNFEIELEVQQFDGFRHAALGSDISIGHALLPLGVGLLYRGKPWMKATAESWSIPKVPDTRVEDWILEAVDLSDSPICYEGLLNFRNLVGVHTIKAQNCPLLDDWCLDILCSEVLGLEQLDLSGCNNISPKGLVPLTRLPKLKRLNLTDCPAFKTNEGMLMCILLQDYNEKLTIEGVDFPEVPQNQSSEMNV